MRNATWLSVRNAEAAQLDNLHVLAPAEFRAVVLAAIDAGARITAYFGVPQEQDTIRLIIVLAHEQAGSLSLTSTDVQGTYLALTPVCPQAHWFEREIAEQWAIRPDGHPWLKPIRFHTPYGSRPALWVEASKADILPGVGPFFHVRGSEVHEVAVGPVHAGVIEPGHFRFQCHGEQVFHLEIALGYQHRGIERALINGPSKRRIHYVETVAGDTSIGHATAYCQALEALSGSRVPARAEALRGIALELERLANHTGDLGALAGDIGFLPTASYCGRLRGDFLNLTAVLCGSRFGRGLVRPGGVEFDIDSVRKEQMLTRLDSAFTDVASAVSLLWETQSVRARFDDAGSLTRETCVQLGLVGPVARACGMERDVRREFPSGMFRFTQIPVSTWETGDVFARATVRWLEIQRSVAFVGEQLSALPEGPLHSDYGSLTPSQIVVSLVEGWRGEICHVALTDTQGQLSAYKIVDPSFHNWMGLAMALRNQPISDFPLCNKSFNLSYCGHDL